MLRKLVTIDSITIGASGYVRISDYYPGAQTGYMFLTAVLYNFGQISSNDAISVTGNGNYLVGTAGAVVTNLQVAYLYSPIVNT